MQDLREFTGVFVNPKLRKLRFETYGLVAPLPVRLPRLENAIARRVWRQTPERGWRPLPPTLAYRSDSASKVSMANECQHLESAMVVASQIASAVAEDRRDTSTKVKWFGEVGIGLIQRVIAEPKWTIELYLRSSAQDS